MTVETIIVGNIKTNCYIYYDPESKRGAVIDPGDEAGMILARVTALGLKIEYIFLTHTHFDHILALNAVREATGARVAVSEHEAAALENPGNGATLGFAIPRARITARVDVKLRDGDTNMVAGTALHVFATPGHTVGSICLDDGENLFTGDTLFEDDCGRCDLPGGDYGVMLASLRRLHDLAGDRKVYPGHDVSTTLSREREKNVDMRRAVGK